MAMNAPYFEVDHSQQRGHDKLAIQITTARPWRQINPGLDSEVTTRDKPEKGKRATPVYQNPKMKARHAFRRRPICYSEATAIKQTEMRKRALCSTQTLQDSVP